MNIPSLDGGGGERETMGNLHLQDRTQDELAEPPDAWLQKMRMRTLQKNDPLKRKFVLRKHEGERKVAIYIIYIYICTLYTYKHWNRERDTGNTSDLNYPTFSRASLKKYCWPCWLENWSDMPTWKHSVYAVRWHQNGSSNKVGKCKFAKWWYIMCTSCYANFKLLFFNFVQVFCRFGMLEFRPWPLRKPWPLMSLDFNCPPEGNGKSPRVFCFFK